MGAAGILTHIMNVEEITAAIRELAGSSRLRRTMGECGYARLKKGYQLGQMIETYQELYREIGWENGKIWPGEEDEDDYGKDAGVYEADDYGKETGLFESDGDGDEAGKTSDQDCSADTLGEDFDEEGFSLEDFNGKGIDEPNFDITDLDADDFDIKNL